MQRTRHNVYRTALGSALRILARRDHSTVELSRKLLRYGYDQEVICGVVAECVRLGYLNDARVAAHVISSLQRNGWGVHRVRNELLKRGLAGETSESILRERSGSAEECAAARKILLKKCKSLAKDPDSRKKYLRLQRFLRSRGFSEPVITDALEALISEPSR